MKQIPITGIIKDGARASTAGTCNNTRKIASKKVLPKKMLPKKEEK